VERIASDAEELASAANILAADLRRACGGEPTPWDKGQRPGAAVIKALDPLVRRLLAGLARHPHALEEAYTAWHHTARLIVWQVVEPLLADLPPTAFIGRSRPQGSRGDRTYRAATAEQVFRHKINKVLYLTKPEVESESNVIEEAS
jgi:CRISPR system Cascade subunit CasA